MSNGDDIHKTMMGISPFRAEDDGAGEDAGAAAHPRSVEERLAAQRKALALKTRPMKALTELDWELPSLGDAAPAAPVTPAPPVAEPSAEETESSELVAEDSGPVESRAPGVAHVTEARAVERPESGADGPSTALTPMPQVASGARSGTIRISAAEIASFTGESDATAEAEAHATHDHTESAPIDEADGESATAPDNDAAAAAPPMDDDAAAPPVDAGDDATDPAPDDALDEPSRGGTMLLSAAALEAAVAAADLAAAESSIGGPTNESPVAGPTGDVAAASFDGSEPTAETAAVSSDDDTTPDAADDSDTTGDDADGDDAPHTASGTMLMSASDVAAMAALSPAAHAEGHDGHEGHHASTGASLPDSTVSLPDRHVVRRPTDVDARPATAHAQEEGGDADPFAERRNYRTGPTVLQSAIVADVPPPARPTARGNELAEAGGAVSRAPAEEIATPQKSNAIIWALVAIVVLAVVAFIVVKVTG